MIFDISHKTLYRYGAPVSQSRHLIHLSPRPFEWQTTRRHSLLIEPAPTARIDSLDYFGNPTTQLSIDDEHVEFVIHARSTIEVRGRASVALAKSPRVDAIFGGLMGANLQLDLDVLRFLSASRHTMPSPALAAYAGASLTPDRAVLDAAWDLTRRIFADFTFDNTSTDVSTPVAKVLKQRRGVCQDFAHLALACLRIARIPARYVSGYLLTRPPEGKPKLKGADASHAWISVWAPESGWVDFDPTNGSMPGPEHIAIAHGRDYDDVAPISGVLLGGGKHTVSVAVDVNETA